jgi:hypothetical protein
MATNQNPYSEQRTATVSTRVTEDEYKELEALAEARGATMSEWVREVLLNQRGEPAGHDVVLAEVMALRTILLNALASIGAGRELTTDKMQELIDRADRERFRRANEKWIEAGNHWMGRSPSQIKNNGKPGKQ